MMVNQMDDRMTRAGWRAGAAAGALCVALATPAFAQEAPPTPPGQTGSDSNISGPVSVPDQNQRVPTQPGGAQLQRDPVQAEDSGLGDIVVTARRVDENLQQVPISVGTLDAVALSNRAITGLQDLRGAIAGVTTSRTTTPGGGYITIRGKTGSAVPSPSADSAVGFYLDGVYVARGQGASAGVPDLARVEVLRGPQGTLFGRNNSAGAINFITNDPSPEPELQFNLLYGNFNELRASTVVNFPITDTLAVRVSYLHEEFDGDVINTTTSPGYNIQGYGSFTPARRLGGNNTDSVVAKVRFTGIDGLTLDYKFDYVDSISAPPPNQLIGFAPSQLLPTLAQIFPVQPPGAVPQSFTRLGAVSHDFQSLTPIENMGHLIVADYELSANLRVKSLTSWRGSDSGGSFDLDGGSWRIFAPPTFQPASFCVNCNTNDMRQRQFSQELQLIGAYDRFNFIAGLFYFNERADFRTIMPLATIIPERPATWVPPLTPFVVAGVNPVTGQPILAPGPLALAEDGFYRNRSYAGYLAGDYAFTDQLKLSVGGRYTIDERSSTDRRPFAQTAAEVRFEEFSYDAALNYQINPDVLVFAKYANGYISGGIFKGIVFQPETLKQAELGFKSEFWNRRVRLNASAYYTWIEDKQTAVPSVNPAANPVLQAAGFSAPFPLGVITYNLPGTSTIRGFEAELTVRPIDSLTLGINGGYNDPRDSDGALPRAPRETFAFSAQYDFPEFANGMFLSLRFDGDYRGEYFGTGLTDAQSLVGAIPAALRPGFATSEAYLAALREATIAGDYWLINGRLSMLDIPFNTSSRATISGFVRNIFDEDGLLYVTNYGATINGAYERPRTYGVELNIRF